MAVAIRAKVTISAKLKEAMRQAPQIVVEELGEGMESITHIQSAVRSQITARGLVERGDLLRSVRGRVTTNPTTGKVSGTVQAGARGRGAAFYAIIHERGGTIRPKKGPFLVFPVGERVEITHIEGRNGQMRQLKRSHMETIPQKWVRVRSVKIRPKWYFRRGVRQGMPSVEASLEIHAYKALRRVFQTEG